MRTRRLQRVFAVSAALLAWLVFVADGAHALFESDAALTENTISTESSSLLISNSQNQNSTIYEQSRPGFSFTLVPGGSDERFFLLKNASVAAVPLSIVMRAALPAVGGLATAVAIQVGPVDEAGNFLEEPPSVLLSNLVSNEHSLPAIIGHKQVQRFKMRVTLHPTFQEQNQSLQYDLRFAGIQVGG